MKKTNKPNPLKMFNDNKAMAYKKAGGEMAAYKKYLRKAENGIEVNSQGDPIKAGPLAERASSEIDYYFRGPRTPEMLNIGDMMERDVRRSPDFNSDGNISAIYGYRKGGPVKRKKK